MEGGGGLAQPWPGGPGPPPASHLGTQLDELRSTSQVAYRFICTGAAGRPGPGPPGGAEPEATATAMEVEVDEDEEEAAAAAVAVDDEVAWASLGGVGCCGVGCCGVGCCCGDWATPDPRWPLPPPAPPGPPPAPPRSAMARPGLRGAGVTVIEATPSGRPGSPPGDGSGRDSSPQPACPGARASERLHAGAGPPGAQPSRSPAAACCGSRRRDRVGVSGAGAGSPGSRRPHPARGAGPGSRSRTPGLRARPSPPGRGVRGPPAHGQPLPSNSERVPASLPAWASPPPSSFRAQRPGQRKPRFSGARPRPEEPASGARLRPLGSAQPGQNPPRVPAAFPADLARGFVTKPSEGSPGDPAAGGPRAVKFPPLLLASAGRAQGPRVQKALGVGEL